MSRCTEKDHPDRPQTGVDGGDGPWWYQDDTIEPWELVIVECEMPPFPMYRARSVEGAREWGDTDEMTGLWGRIVPPACCS